MKCKSKKSINNLSDPPAQLIHGFPILVAEELVVLFSVTFYFTKSVQIMICNSETTGTLPPNILPKTAAKKSDTHKSHDKPEKTRIWTISKIKNLDEQVENEFYIPPMIHAEIFAFSFAESAPRSATVKCIINN